MERIGGAAGGATGQAGGFGGGNGGALITAGDAGFGGGAATSDSQGNESGGAIFNAAGTFALTNSILSGNAAKGQRGPALTMMLGGNCGTGADRCAALMAYFRLLP